MDIFKDILITKKNNMKESFRLTVHVANQPKVDTKAPQVFTKKGPQETAVDAARKEAKKQRSNTPQESSKGRYKVYNTLSSYHNTREDCMKELANIKMYYDIQLGNDFNKKSKYNKELWQISFVN